MLILNRKPGQTIRIRPPGGAEIIVHVLEGSNARLGFEAPREVEIVRSELPRGTCPDCRRALAGCRCGGGGT